MTPRFRQRVKIAPQLTPLEAKVVSATLEYALDPENFLYVASNEAKAARAALRKIGTALVQAGEAKVQR